MAQGAANRRAKKQNNYFDIGNKGRVTGTQVADTGNRDEHGFELVEEFFPPTTAKTVRTQNNERRKSGATIASSESMDIVLSSGPSPGEALTGQTSRSRRTPVPSRSSPFKKTSLGATPKRISVGPASPTKESPAELPPSTDKTARRKLYFGQGDPASASRSPEHRAPLLAASSSRRDTDRNVYSLSKSPERSRRVTAGRESMIDTTQEPIEDEIEVNGTAENDYIPAMGDEEDDALGADLEVEEAPDAELTIDPQLEDPPLHSSPTAHRSKNTPRRSQGSNSHEANGVDTAVIHASGGSRSSQKRSAPEEDPSSEPPRKRRGRPPKNRDQAESSAQAKKTKPKAKAGRAKTRELSQARSTSPREHYHNRGMTVPMQRERHETPAEGEYIRRSRFGRVTYQPLEYWKGEHAVFKRHERAASIEEIVRMDDITPLKRPTNTGRRKKQQATVFEDEEVDPNDFVEDWELGDGVVVGQVRNWDPILGQASTEMNDAGESLACSRRLLNLLNTFATVLKLITTATEIAFAADRIDPRQVADANFRYAKTLTMPFFGSGVVELPPGGFKSAKNSKKMLLVFFVFYGKVTVNVSGTTFTITKGGQWQVPRGEFRNFLSSLPAA
ncbi:MAG: hypothetical protein M1828_003593 [Chrysothrix sp. TS-e1954]|nr:MAG: hypothetical protein M1828_003593 [Chrysothrix sp. TS-e1954]